MNAIKLLVGLVLLSFSFNSHAQIEDLPVSASGAISLTGEIGKQVGESLEQAFERNYASGILGVISREMTGWRYQEIYWFAEANDWFNSQGMVGTSVGAQELFAGIINGKLDWGTPVVEIIDCPDGVCEEIP